MRPSALVLSVVIVTIIGLFAVASVQPARANPAAAILDANSPTPTDVIQQTTFTQTRTFRVGVILDLAAGEALNDVFAWQFVIHYDPAFVTALGDPPVANDFFSASCYATFTCSENAGPLVNFGRVGAANWGGRVDAGGASTVIKVDDPAFGPGTVLVAITTLAPATGFNIPAGTDTQFASVNFEIDVQTATPVSFSLSDVIVTNSAAVVIPVTAGGPVTVTIGNAPPVAFGIVVSTSTPAVGETVAFDASLSTDAGGITNYIWDFGAGDVDGDGFTDSSCDTVAMTCASATATYAFQTAGTYRVTLRVRDNQGATGSARDQLGEPLVNDQPSHRTFTITVGGTANNPPTLTVPGPQTVNEEAALSFTVTATDPDAGQTVTLSATGVPPGATFNPATGLFSWTPDEAQGPGSVTVTFTATDDALSPLSDTEIVVITVNEVNLPPILNPTGGKTVDELSLLTFTATATDPDLPSQILTFSLGTGAPSGATITSLGVFTWVPTEAQGPGSYPVTIIVSDASLTDSEAITVSVLEVNQAPLLDPVGDKSADEGTLLTFTAIASDADLPVQSLTFSLGPGAPTGASISPGGVFTWTPSEEQGPGTYPVTIIVSDGALTDSEEIMITVAEVNVAPVLNPVGSKTVEEGSELTFTATATDGDIPAQTPSFSLEPAAIGNFPTGASITPAGLFTWTPTLDQGPGTYMVNVVVSDSSLTDFEQITITVTEPTPGNHAPVLDAIGDKTIDEEVQLMFTATASDVDGDALTFSMTGGPLGSSIGPNTGVFTWTPTEAQGPGNYPVTIVVSDGSLSDSETITITVSEVNGAPVLVAIGDKTVDEETALSFTATASDIDLPPNPLQFSLSGPPPGASITPEGVFSWTPTEAQGPGTYQVTVNVSDGLLMDSEALTITVNEVNSPPVAAFTFTFIDSNGNGAIDTGETVNFDASASSDPDIPADPITNYAWDFGDTGTGTGQTVSHIYTTGGDFTVMLTVTDSHSTTDSAFATVPVGTPLAHARLNRWKASPEFHHQDIGKFPTQTLRAQSVNDGEVTVYAYVLFTIVTDTGPSQMLTSSIVALAPGEQISGKSDPRFAVTFNPEAGSYTVTATVYYTPTPGLPVGDTGYTADLGSSKTFSFNAVQR